MKGLQKANSSGTSQPAKTAQPGSSLYRYLFCKCMKLFSRRMTRILTRLTLSQRQVLDTSKPKELADHNSNFDENGRQFYKRVENNVGNGEIARYEQFLLYPQCFQKTCSEDT